MKNLEEEIIKRDKIIDILLTYIDETGFNLVEDICKKMFEVYDISCNNWTNGCKDCIKYYLMNLKDL